MNETKICPVCENEIPEDARFLCPHCHFELKGLDDEESIEEAKQNFTGELFTVEKPSEMGIESNPEKEHLIAGVIGAVIAQFVYLIGWPGGEVGWALFCLPLSLLLCLPPGFFAGVLGYQIEKNLNRRLNIGFVFLILTFILSVVISVLILVIWHDIAPLPY